MVISGIEGKKLPSLEELEKDIKAQLKPKSDFRGSAEFKGHMAGVLAASTLHSAWNGKEVVK